MSLKLSQTLCCNWKRMRAFWIQHQYAPGGGGGGGVIENELSDFIHPRGVLVGGGGEWNHFTGTCTG